MNACCKTCKHGEESLNGSFVICNLFGKLSIDFVCKQFKDGTPELFKIPNTERPLGGSVSIKDVEMDITIITNMDKSKG